MPDAERRRVRAGLRAVHTGAAETAAGGGQEAAAAVRERLYAGAREIGALDPARGRAFHAARRRFARCAWSTGQSASTSSADPATGEVIVRRCAFSAALHTGGLSFVSALDAGFFHGVSDRWSVAFDDRITDGAPGAAGVSTEVQPR